MSAKISAASADDAALVGLVAAGASELALPLADDDIHRLIAYVRLIERWNATYNLTAIRDSRDMAIHHILDCLAAAAALRRRRGERAERLLDVGSGAGLPGVVLAIASPSRHITCVDRVGKKVAFVTHAAGALGLKNLTAAHHRVESLVGSFDVVASRAFASLGEFVEETRHLLDESGTWMAMKAKVPEAELSGLHGQLTIHVERLVVPNLAAERCVVWLNPVLEASARS